MSSWVEGLLIAVILFGIGYTIFRGGAANPVGTGSLQARVTAIDASVKEIKTDLRRAASEMKELESSRASSSEFEALRETMQGDRRRTEQVFLKIESVETDIAQMRTHQGTRDVVIEALSASVRKLSSELEEHQAAIAKKLDRLNAVSGQVASNTKAIEAIVAQLPALRDRQAEIAAKQAETARDVKHVAAQVDRLYNFLTEKALK